MFQIDRLPHEPERFFELSDGYDRRALKRAYGKAIRQYTPEDAPQEFQLVREAYEQLERTLRYNRDQARNDEANQAWASVNPPPENQPNETPTGRRPLDQSESGASKRSQPSPSVQQLALADPTGTYRRLSKKSTRSPQEYYVTAVLADLVDQEPPAEYFHQILLGIVEHPSDTGLLNLATAYLRQEVEEDDLASTVELVASKVPASLFFPLTETLWLRLIQSVAFDRWQPLLKRCENRFPRVDTLQSSAFYVQILKVAIWNAPIEWSSEQLTRLESNSACLDEFSQFELEYLGHLQRLLRSHADWKRLPPIKQKLLEAYRLHCQSDDPHSARTLMEHLGRLARNPVGFQNAFPVGTDQDDQSWVIATQLMINQVSHQTLTNSSDDPDRMLDSVGKLLRDLTPTNQAVLEGQNKANSRFRTLPLVLWMIFGCLFGTPLIILPIAFANDSIAAWLALGLIVLVFVSLFISYFRWLYPRFLQKRQERYAWRWLMQGYQRHWRQRLFRFSQSNSLSIGNLFRFIIECTQGTKWQAMGETLQYFGSQDAGLVIYVSIRLAT